MKTAVGSLGGIFALITILLTYFWIIPIDNSHKSNPELYSSNISRLEYYLESGTTQEKSILALALFSSSISVGLLISYLCLCLREESEQREKDEIQAIVQELEKESILEG